MQHESGGFGKPQRGREMAKVAELLLAKPGTERMKARAVFVCEGLINHWTKPLKETLAPLLAAYHVVKSFKSKFFSLRHFY